jgi:hypothetical protein
MLAGGKGALGEDALTLLRDANAKPTANFADGTGISRHGLAILPYAGDKQLYARSGFSAARWALVATLQWSVFPAVGARAVAPRY